MTKKTVVTQTQQNVSTKNETELQGMSTQAYIFQNLPVENQKKYFVDQFGTVKGTTGFFDYWFHKSIGDVKKIIDKENTIFSVCVARDGGHYEGGGGDVSNFILVIRGDKIYRSADIKYTDVSYGTNIFTWKTSSTESGKTNEEYQEIIDCIWEKDSDICLIKIKVPGGEKTIKTAAGNQYRFDEVLLSSLYVPSEIVAKTSDATKQQLQTLFTIPTDYADEDMQVTCLEVLVDQGNRSDAMQIIRGNKSGYHAAPKHDPLLPSAKLDTPIQKLFASYMGEREKTPYKENSWGTSAIFSDTIKHLYGMLYDKTLKEQAGQRIINYLLSTVGHTNSDIDFCMNIIQDIWLPTEIYYQRIFDACYKSSPFDVSNISYEIDKAYARIDKLAASKQENYQRLYDHNIVGRLPYLVCNAHSTEETWNRTKSFFTTRGVQYDPFTANVIDIAQEKNPTGLPANLQQLIKHKFITQDKAQEIITHNIWYIYAYIQKSYDHKQYSENAKYLAAMYKTLQGTFAMPVHEIWYDAMVYLVWNKDRNWWIQDMASRNQDLMTSVVVAAQKIKEIDQSRFLWTLEENSLLPPEYALSYAQELFKKWSFSTLKSLLKKNPHLQEKDTELYDESIAKAAIRKEPSADEYIKHLSVEAAKELIPRYGDMEKGPFARYNDPYKTEQTIDALSAICQREDITQEYIMQLIAQAYANWDYKTVWLLCKGAWLKLDKKIVNMYIDTLVSRKKLDDAWRLAYAAGLQDIRSKKITEDKIQTGVFEANAYRMAKEIEEYKLDPVYHNYVIQIYLRQRELLSAMNHAHTHKLIITPTQIDIYRQACAEQIAKELEQQKQREIAQQKAKEKRELDAPIYLSDIDANKCKVDIEYTQAQKYVFGYSPETGPMVLSRSLEWHADIVKTFGVKPADMLGWGWIRIDEADKKVSIYGSSGSYGPIYQEFVSVVKKLFQRQYPDYIISRDKE